MTASYDPRADWSREDRAAELHDRWDDFATVAPGDAERFERDSLAACGLDRDGFVGLYGELRFYQRLVNRARQYGYRL